MEVGPSCLVFGWLPFHYLSVWKILIPVPLLLQLPQNGRPNGLSSYGRETTLTIFLLVERSTCFVCGRSCRDYGPLQSISKATNRPQLWYTVSDSIDFPIHSIPAPFLSRFHSGSAVLPSVTILFFFFILSPTEPFNILISFSPCSMRSFRFLSTCQPNLSFLPSFFANRLQLNRIHSFFARIFFKRRETVLFFVVFIYLFLFFCFVFINITWKFFRWYTATDISQGCHHKKTVVHFLLVGNNATTVKCDESKKKKQTQFCGKFKLQKCSFPTRQDVAKEAYNHWQTLFSCSSTSNYSYID